MTRSFLLLGLLVTAAQFYCGDTADGPLSVVPDDHPLAGEYPVEPPLLRAAVSKDTAIHVSWDWNRLAHSYVVYRATGSADTWKTAGTIDRYALNRDFVDADVVPGTRYRYTAAAVTAAGLEGRKSTELDIKCVIPAVLYLRKKMMSTQQGNAVPFIVDYLYPRGGPVLTYWYAGLESRRLESSSYGYSLQIQAEAACQLRIEFVHIHDGQEILEACDTITVKGDGTLIACNGVVPGTVSSVSDGDLFLVILIHISGSGTAGIAYDGSSGKNSFITCPYLIKDPWAQGDDLTQVKTCRQLASPPAGLTWDGENIWYAGIATRLGIYKLSETCVTTDTLPSPCDDPMDLAWDGRYLLVIDAWGNDDKGNLVYRFGADGPLLPLTARIALPVLAGRVLKYFILLSILFSCRESIPDRQRFFPGLVWYSRFFSSLWRRVSVSVSEPAPALFVAIIRIGIIAIPLAYVLVKVYGMEMDGLYWALGISNAFAMPIALSLMFVIFRKLARRSG